MYYTCFSSMIFQNHCTSLLLDDKMKIQGVVDMEIRILKYFLTVAREENITKAAETLHITQPTLSRQLAQMEEEMGVTLFIRGTRKITLTHEGMLLRRRAEEILELVDKTEKEMTQQQKLVEGTVSIGCGDLYAVQILAKLMSNFTNLYPNVTFDLYTATADHIRERIDRGLTDVGLLLEPVDLSKYDFVRMKHKERWIVILPLDSPLVHKEYITANDLLSYPLILPNRLNMQSELANWFGDSFTQLNVLLKSNLTSNAAIMVQQGMAYAIVIEGSISFWDQKKITYRPLSPALFSTTALAWKREQPFSLPAAKFIEYAKNNLNKIEV